MNQKTNENTIFEFVQNLFFQFFLIFNESSSIAKAESWDNQSDNL